MIRSPKVHGGELCMLKVAFEIVYHLSAKSTFVLYIKLHIVLSSDYLTDCLQALFFQQDTLVY